MTSPTSTVMQRRASISPSSAIAAALRGEPCRVFGMGPGLELVPACRWRGEADTADHKVLSQCRGATVDIGCGPGRMTHALLGLGIKALGIDVVDEAVQQTRARGAVALRRDVFSQLPGEGRWRTALLADGNIGIGGDPVRLLRRTRTLLARDGRVVIDLSKPGGAVCIHWIGLEVSGRRSRTFPWAVVPACQIKLLAELAAFLVLEVAEHEGRWFATLAKQGRI